MKFLVGAFFLFSLSFNHVNANDGVVVSAVSFQIVQFEETDDQIRELQNQVERERKRIRLLVPCVYKKECLALQAFDKAFSSYKAPVSAEWIWKTQKEVLEKLREELKKSSSPELSTEEATKQLMSFFESDSSRFQELSCLVRVKGKIVSENFLEVFLHQIKIFNATLKTQSNMPMVKEDPLLHIV